MTMTSGFKTPLQVEAIDETTWVLLADLVWHGSQGDAFVVEAGEETDFATIPWWTQAIVPRTGTWTKAAVVHDKMCNELNRWHEMTKGSRGWADLNNPLRGTGWVRFNAVDTDAVFRKIARDEGTDRVRSELLWVGVRYGALVNAARREGWLSTAPRVLADTLAILAVLVATVAGLSWAWPW